MIPKLLIHHIELLCHEEVKQISFLPGVNLIEGPVGTGKSSLFELIKYAFGGDGILTKAVRQGVRGLSMLVEVSGRTYRLERKIGAGTIKAFPEDARLSETWNVSHKKKPSASERLLELLGLPDLSIPKARSKVTGTSIRLSFFDFYDYMYLSQTEIDRSVVHHLDTYRTPQRMAAFEALYGLRTEEISKLEVEKDQLQEELSAKKRTLYEVRKYLERARQPEESEIQSESAELRANLNVARQDLHDLHGRLFQETDANHRQREELKTLYMTLRDITAQRESAYAQLEMHDNLVAQLQLDQRRLEKSEQNQGILGSITFEICPNCLQKIPTARTSTDTCYVCLQELTKEELEANAEREISRLSLQIQETQELLNSDRTQLEELDETLENLKKLVRARERELDSSLEEFISPHLKRIEEVSRRIAELETREALIARSLEYWIQYRAMETAIEELIIKIRNIDEVLQHARAAQETARERIRELSNTFQEIVRYLEVPWYESAYIDSKNYLPIFNEQKFQNLTAGSGGIPTLVNDAYHLAGLVFSITNLDVLYPRFLAIDSPRKGLGRHKENEIIQDRIYRFFRRLADTYGEKFQLIVGDNDIPEEFRNFVRLSLDYDRPLIPGIEHPGEGKVETIEDYSRATS